jgi:hypothetical protein
VSQFTKKSSTMREQRVKGIVNAEPVSDGLLEFDKETCGVPITCSDNYESVSSDVANVFVVDDDAAVRRALGRLLRSAGYEPETFACA